ncbi:hypothetical protein BU26DRAFT_10361 [Trematosphaeria pertusa]|uniref:LIM zinc-binding domain-containing protein n=1 Tax=Trematosphaeria pertusa TaxID=390896 RepID=A0A6A6IZA1_9PLEO|nr:uncharacterized protein BU26DRAFT_10361 [Trematosphaeria pertusa]KAF2255885.1 hypothetical protein BU26DRAFT_10361 [Trematosphaeria pertusa]
MHKGEGASAPSSVYMSPQQMTNYLQELRTNRPARPTGSRPPPAHFNTWSSRSSSRFAESPAVSPFSHPTFKDAGVDVDAPPPVAPESKSHRRTTSNMSIDEVLASSGRPLVQPPRGRDMTPSTTSRERTPSVQYRESSRRQAERDEARALRIAMEELEFKDEKGLYEAARDEAAELVWKHRNPDAPGTSPNAAYPYPGLDGNGSSQRSRSLGRAEQDLQRSNSKLRKRNSMATSASGSRSSSLQSRRAPSGSSVTANAGFSTSPTKAGFTSDSSEEPTALPRASSDPTDPKHRRRTSSGSRRKISASLFKNPDDQIYEEPEEETPSAAPAPAVANPPPAVKLPLGVRRNPFARVQFSRDNNLVRSNTDPLVGTKRFDRYEIQNNPPSQSRNAAYTLNPLLSKPSEDGKSDAENDAEVKTKDGKEVRSDDIRAATGFKLKDRSPKLPTPTMVSDSPGRPIVSFKKDWRLKEVELMEEISALPGTNPRPLSQTAAGPHPLSKAATAPVVPTMSMPAEPSKETKVSSPSLLPQVSVTPTLPAPSMKVNRAQMPTISVYEDPPARPLPSATTSRKVNTPQAATPPVPTINVSQAPPARSKPSAAPPIPTISVQETPSISVSGPSGGAHVKAPSISVTPSIPTISVSESPAPARGPKINVPSIAVTPSVPSINLAGPVSSTRPLPTPKTGSKSLPHNATATANSRSHWTPTNVRNGALCAQCALPISGRIVSAAGVRFHPECFLCHHCGEHLECVAFYPEPDNKRAERLSRIHARQRGEDIEFLPSHPTLADMQRLEAEDGDESMRFYCHLDFHEFFSPRCKSCKTPIEGEVVVACGAEWHVGHFFCAQCGDPFDSTTPFVEKDGYAWCVDCHTNRYSTKCKKCRKPVTDTVVKAMGAEWHAGCFCCVECSGPFEDGRYFLRGDSQDPVCVKCEERRLKA